MELKEKQLGKGAVYQIDDERDLAFSAGSPFDWELGFDIELLLGFRQTCKTQAEFFGERGAEGWGVDRYREIVQIVAERNIQPFKIPIKNQGVSLSCVGQSLSYFLEVFNMIETGEHIPVSAKDIYAYIYLKNGGAYLRDALKLATDRGAGTEELVPCYTEFITGGRLIKTPLSEDAYRERPEETEALKAIRKALQLKKYRSIVSYGEDLMDKMAWAMLMGFGAYFAVNGQNGKGWLSEYPQIPDIVTWAHALFGGKAFLEDGEKVLSHINSWGNTCGADGWQKLKLDYFTSFNVISPWTLIDKNNNNNTHMDLTKYDGFLVQLVEGHGGAGVVAKNAKGEFVIITDQDTGKLLLTWHQRNSGQQDYVNKKRAMTQEEWDSCTKVKLNWQPVD